jgi:hypothetical protein
MKDERILKSGQRLVEKIVKKRDLLTYICGLKEPIYGWTDSLDIKEMYKGRGFSIGCEEQRLLIKK